MIHQLCLTLHTQENTDFSHLPVYTAMMATIQTMKEDSVYIQFIVDMMEGGLYI